MLKKLVSLILAVIMLYSFPLNAADPIISVEGILQFYDVRPNSWYYDSVVFCYVNDIINGMTATSYEPNSKLTRAQFVTMLANLEGVGGQYTEVDCFKDVKRNHWYYKYVAWAYSKGIVSGTSADTFSPNMSISRETMARIICLYMQTKGYNVMVREDALDGFSDKGNISSWAVEGMKYCVSAGLITGMTETELSPKSTLTRAQAARILSVLTEDYYYGGHTHIYKAASCTVSSYCTVCGLKKTLPTGHIVNDYKCTEGGVCDICGYMLIDPKPHMYNSTATCTTPCKCSDCGYIKTPALGHTTDCGICSRCNKEIFATKFDKAVYYLKKDGIYDDEIGSYFKLHMYRVAENEYTYTVLEYSPSSDSINIINEYDFQSGNLDSSTIIIERNSNKAYFSYQYVYNGYYALIGNGSININSFTKDTAVALDEYEGYYNQPERLNVNRSIKNAVSMANTILNELYGGSVADIGFLAF